MDDNQTQQNEAHINWRFVITALVGLFLWHKLKTVRARQLFWTRSSSPGTALITGASSGIGAAFARRLAIEGYNLILVARREEKLNHLADQLKHRYPIRADVLVADLTRPKDIAKVEAKITELDSLTLLINNAGFGTRNHFAEATPERQFEMVQLHINATVQLCRAALPGMIERRYGGIINVSSISAFFRPPERVTYGATKAFLNIFSEALQIELRETGVYIQALCPGFTYTEFHDTQEFADFSRVQIPDILWMPADTVVRESLEALGAGVVVIVPGLVNRLLVMLAKFGLIPLAQKINRQLFRRDDQHNQVTPEPNR